MPLLILVSWMLNGHPTPLVEVVGPLIPFSVLEYVFPQATLNWSQGDYRGHSFGDDGIFYFTHFFLECSSSCHYLHLLKSKPLFSALTAVSLYLKQEEQQATHICWMVFTRTSGSCFGRPVSFNVITSLWRTYYLSSLICESWNETERPWTDGALLEVTKLISGRAGTRTLSLTSELGASGPLRSH